MNFWKVILATIVIYGAGVMTGGLLVNHVSHNYYSHSRNPHRPEMQMAASNSISHTNGQNQALSKQARQPEMLSRQFLQRLDEELHLTADQRATIQKIITDGQNLMHKTILDTRLEIREQLTPEQRIQFDGMVKRQPRRLSNATNAPPASVPAAATNAPGV